MIRYVELRPVTEIPSEYERIEKRITDAFIKLLYAPLLRQLTDETPKLKNADDARSSLERALLKGTIWYHDGVFHGKLSAAVSRELRTIGAEWDRREKVFKLAKRQLPYEVLNAISLSESRFKDRMARADALLEKLLPEEIAGTIKTADLFDSALWKVDRSLKETAKGISVMPQLTPEEAARVGEEWQTNMDLWVKDFSEKQILDLRQMVAQNVAKGLRYDTLIKNIHASFGVTKRKAKFLASQETRLMMAKFKESRYTSAGIDEYRWACVKGSPLHPVRDSHKVLDRKVFRWNDPPITTGPNEPQRRNNPGQDYNCRCSAIPLVRRRK